MFRIALASMIVIVLSPDRAAACSGDPIDGFTCSLGERTGPIFTPFSAYSPSPLSPVVRRAIERLQEEEAGGLGGGASADVPQRLGVFVDGLAAFKDIDQRRELGSDSDTLGTRIGMDYRGERFVVGASLDYRREETDFDDNRGNYVGRSTGNLDTDEFGIELIGVAYPVGNLYLAGSARFAYDNYETKRTNRAKGSPDGHKVSAAAGAGYDFDLGSGVIVGLSGFLNFEWKYVESYKEGGARVFPGDVAFAADLGFGDPLPANLRYNDDDIYSLQSVLEVNGQKAVNFKWGVLIPEVFARYLHQFDNDSRTIQFALLENGEPVEDGRYRTNQPDRDYMNLGGALTAVLPGGLAFFVDYHAELEHSYRQEQVVNFGVRAPLDYLFGLAGGSTDGS